MPLHVLNPSPKEAGLVGIRCPLFPSEGTLLWKWPIFFLYGSSFDVECRPTSATPPCWMNQCPCYCSVSFAEPHTCYGRAPGKVGQSQRRHTSYTRQEPITIAPYPLSHCVGPGRERKGNPFCHESSLPVQPVPGQAGSFWSLSLSLPLLLLQPLTPRALSLGTEVLPCPGTPPVGVLPAACQCC